MTTELTRQEITDEGISPTFSAADADGNSYVNDEGTFLVAKNGDGSNDHTVTVQVQRATFNRQDKLGDVDFADIAITVAMGDEQWIWVPAAPYNDGNGKVRVTYDQAGSFTVAAIKLPT